MRIICSVVFLLITLNTFSQKEISLITKAKKEMTKGNLDKTIILLDKAIDINPKNINAYIYLGMTYEKLNDYNSAIKNYSLALSNGYDLSLLSIRRAYCYYKTDQFQLALEDLNLINTNNPNSAEVLHLRGNVQQKNKKYNEAIEDFSNAINDPSVYRNKHLIYIYSSRSQCYSKTQQFEKALSDCNLIIETPRYISFGYAARGDIYIDMKEYSKAIHDYTVAIATDNNNKYAYRGRIYSYYKDKNFEKLFLDSEFYLNKFKDNDKFVRKYKGIALQQLGKHDESLAVFDLLINENPNDGDILNQRACLHLLLNNVNEALDDANKAIEADPTNSTPYRTKAEVLFQQGNFSEMCANIEKAFEIGFDVEEYRKEYGYILEKCNK